MMAKQINASHKSDDGKSAGPLPAWLKVRLPARYDDTVKRTLNAFGITTVCREAHCPNQGECWHRGAAAFMILGDICTRNCRFCAVASGRPRDVDRTEPARVAAAAERLGLKHIVITSVSRDDLFDEGAAHYAAVIQEIKRRMTATVEVLPADFHARPERIQTVLDAGPDIFNHNIETVEKFYPDVRPQADYRRSLKTLALAAEIRPDIPVKSGMMVGFGETKDDVFRVFDDLRAAGVTMLTVGQYLPPKRGGYAPLVEYVTPDRFKEYETRAISMGFAAVACGPLVRSSYMADAMWMERNTRAGSG